MTENITADEQKTTQDVGTTDTNLGVATSAGGDVVSKADYEKAIANAEKREGRYKSTMKKSSAEEVKTETTAKTTDTTDIGMIVEQKLAKIKEEEAFTRKHGDGALDSVTSVLEKYPNLSLDDAYKLSPQGQDTAVNADTNVITMVGVAGDVDGGKNQITEAQLYSLPDAQYAEMRDKIESGAMRLVG